jgi:hypothetical protein
VDQGNEEPEQQQGNEENEVAQEPTVPQSAVGEEHADE